MLAGMRLSSSRLDSQSPRGPDRDWEVSDPDIVVRNTEFVAARAAPPKLVQTHSEQGPQSRSAG
jgi:hypothetical protein